MSAVPLPIGLPTKSGPSVDVTRDLLVRETFGPTWQGEGEHVGHVAAFVRLGGCNQHCWWCDEPQSWVYDERHAAMHRDGITYDPKVVLTRRSPKDVATDALARLPGHGCVVITGGEPMLQQPGVLELLRCIREIGDGFFPCVEIETAGTIPTSTSVLWELVQFNVSPKLEHSGNELELRYRPEVLRRYASHWATFKFVATTERDLDEVARIQEEVGIDSRLIWIMGEGVTADLQITRMRHLAPYVLERGWNLTPRLHTLIWDNQKGH